MELLLDTGVSGHPAVDTASTPVGGVHLEWHTASRPKLELPQVPTPHRTDHHLWNVSYRDTTAEVRTKAAASQTDHQRTPREIHLFPTNCFQRHTHVQQVAGCLHVDK